MMLCAFLLLNVSACTHSRPVDEAQSEPDRRDEIEIGYGQQDSDDVASSVSSVDTETARRTKPRNLSDMLKGRVSGVYVNETSGGLSIRIRGVTSPSGNNEPLYVIDGVPTFPSRGGVIAGLSPFDIDTIEVLKGGAAAIYGSRGANGVILINTKRGLD